MGNPESPTSEEARPGGPVPQGAPPAEGPPSGDPPASGASPTGHPPASPDAPEETHPSPEQETPSADGQGDIDDQDMPSSPAALKILLKRAQAERADYLQQMQRVKADFENYRKRMLRQQTEHVERAAEQLVEKLLPVLDNFEAAIAHGTGYEQVQASLLALLEREGLTRIHPEGKPFDPSEADAVAHEDGDGGPVVAEVLRAGYRWKGRVVRPAMVRVRG